MSSASLSLHKKRRVFPRMYSLGCCKSFLIPLLRPECQQGRNCEGNERASHEPDQDHFLLQLAIGVELGANLVVKVQQLLQSLVLRGHDESNDVHEQVGHGIAIEHDRENALHGLDFALVGALLELRAQVREGGDVGGIVLVHQAVRIFQKRGHRGGCGVMLLARCRRCG